MNLDGPNPVVELAAPMTTPRLTLRAWQPSDAPAVAAILADEAMHAHLLLPHPYTRQHADRFVTQPGHSDTELSVAVVHTESGRLVGSGALRLPTRSDLTSAEIGYWIAQSDAGHGLGTELARALGGWAFDRGVPRCEIRCAVANTASAKLALNAGFAFEAVHRDAVTASTGVSDCAVFARLATDSGAPIEVSWPGWRPLGDGDISLRAAQATDWPVLLAEMTNTESRRWSLNPEMFTEQQARSRYQRAGLDWLVGQRAPLIICDTATGIGIGTMQLRHDGPPGAVALGYGVLPGHRGRRVTARALKLIVDWARGRPEIHRLELGCDSDNVASARSAELAGFIREGVAAGWRRPDGTVGAELRYGLVVG